MPAARAEPHAAGRGRGAVPLARARRFRPGEAGRQARVEGGRERGVAWRPAAPRPAVGLGRPSPAPLGALPGCLSPACCAACGGAAAGSEGRCRGERRAGLTWGLARERANRELGFRQWAVGVTGSFVPCRSRKAKYILSLFGYGIKG